MNTSNKFNTLTHKHYELEYRLSNKGTKSIKELQIKYEHLADLYKDDFSFKEFYSKDKSRVLFGCTKDFYKDLVASKAILPVIGKVNSGNRTNAYREISKILGWDGLFFGWIIPKSDYEFCSDSDYYLLELDIPTKFLVPHSYYNWCDYIFSCDCNENERECVCEAEFGCSLSSIEAQTFLPVMHNLG